MTNDHWHHLALTLDQMRSQRDRHAAAVKGLMIAPESPLCDPLGRIEQLLVNTLARLVGAAVETLNWYIYDCDYGRNPSEAGIDGDMRLIDSPRRLRWLIELSYAPDEGCAT